MYRCDSKANHKSAKIVKGNVIVGKALFLERSCDSNYHTHIPEHMLVKSLDSPPAHASHGNAAVHAMVSGWRKSSKVCSC